MWKERNLCWQQGHKNKKYWRKKIVDSYWENSWKHVVSSIEVSMSFVTKFGNICFLWKQHVGVLFFEFFFAKIRNPFLVKTGGEHFKHFQLITLKYLLSEQDVISEQGGAKISFSTWKKDHGGAKIPFSTWKKRSGWCNNFKIVQRSCSLNRYYRAVDCFSRLFRREKNKEDSMSILTLIFCQSMWEDYFSTKKSERRDFDSNKLC